MGLIRKDFIWSKRKNPDRTSTDRYIFYKKYRCVCDVCGEMVMGWHSRSNAHVKCRPAFREMYLKKREEAKNADKQSEDTEHIEHKGD